MPAVHCTSPLPALTNAGAGRWFRRPADWAACCDATIVLDRLTGGRVAQLEQGGLADRTPVVDSGERGYRPSVFATAAMAVAVRSHPA